MYLCKELSDRLKERTDTLTPTGAAKNYREEDWTRTCEDSHDTCPVTTLLSTEPRACYVIRFMCWERYFIIISFSMVLAPHDWIDNFKPNITTYHLIALTKRGLCLDSRVRHFVCGSVCVSHGYGYTLLPIIMQFGVYVLGTKVERSISTGFLISLPFSKWRLFCGSFSQLTALSEIYCSQK